MPHVIWTHEIICTSQFNKNNYIPTDVKSVWAALRTHWRCSVQQPFQDGIGLQKRKWYFSWTLKVVEDSSKVEMREESFQLQRIVNIHVEIRKSEKNLRSSRWSSLIRIEDPCRSSREKPDRTFRWAGLKL